MNMNAKYFYVFSALIAGAALLIFAFPRTAAAVGTLSGAAITSDATISAANAATATAASPATTVVSIYGITTNSQPADSITTTGGIVYYKLKFTNKANINDNISLHIGPQTFSAGAGTTTNWAVEVDDADPFVTGLAWNNSGTTNAAQGGDFTSVAIGPDVQATFTIKIISASNASDGSTMSAPIWIQTTRVAGTYMGFNGVSYGGAALEFRTAGALSPDKLTTTIQGAVLTLTKAVAVQSPAQYQTLGGGAATPVPGSKITYAITYKNNGLVGAANVTIIDNIPAGAAYLPGTITTSAFGAQTDAADGDKCDYNVSNAGAVTCNAGTVPAGSGDLTIQYQAAID
jgi:uncharacterized repeat protein (TIGR01451 family)